MTMTMATGMATGMATRIWAQLVAVAVAPPGEESGDGDADAAAAAHIEKMELRMDNVSRRSGGRQVVDGMSMSVRRGHVLGLLGPNGAGKSTAFNIGMGYMSQGSSVFGGKHSAYTWRSRSTVCSEQHAHRVQELIEAFSVRALETTMGRALSGGERGGRSLRPPSVQEGPQRFCWFMNLLLPEVLKSVIPRPVREGILSRGH